MKTALVACVLMGAMVTFRGLAAQSGAPLAFTNVSDLVSGAEVQRPTAVVSQSVMAILMAVFVGLCVRSFMGASRADRAA